MKKVKLIGEIGINHNGNIETAKDMILMAKGCGWDYVKFQKRDINIVYDQEFLDGPRDSPWGTTQREQKEGLEFSIDDFRKINYFCKMNKIEWFSSCWDINSLHQMESFDPPFHKIASPMLTNLAFCEEVARLGRSTIVSTGMSEFNDICSVYNMFKSYDTPMIIMHCVSMYPCPPEKCNIAQVNMLKGAFPDVEIGYSGHETGISPTVAAIVMGATYIERHITLDRAMYGSDQAASIERPGMVKIRQYADEIVRCLGTEKKQILPEEKENAKKLRYWE